MEAKIMWTTIIAIAVITTLLITMLMASISKMKTPDEKRQDKIIKRTINRIS